MTRAVLGIGSNLGDRMNHLASVVRALGPCLDAVSDVYETEPVGSAEPQQDYFNAVVIAHDDAHDATGWLAWAQQCEAAAQRVRTVRWGPRTLDVDILDVDGQISGGARLILPHPRAHERAFVLVPWVEVDPTAVVAGRGPARELLAALGTAGVRRRADLTLQR